MIGINPYDEYGIPAASNRGRFQYTGQVWLPELGLRVLACPPDTPHARYYYKARIYSPRLGRFLQTDPIGYKDNNNLYAYVGNDPINGVDFTGTRKATTGERRMLNRVFGAQMAIVPVYSFPISRSVSFPYEIDFASKIYSDDFSRSRDSAQRYTYWHEQYHVFEMSIGYKSWISMAAEQVRSGFGPEIYRWDDSKDFNSQTFEARAAAFGGCMSGGSCSRLEGMSISGRGTTLSFKNGTFTLTQGRTDSRIPKRTTFKPKDLEPKKDD